MEIINKIYFLIYLHVLMLKVGIHYDFNSANNKFREDLRKLQLVYKNANSYISHTNNNIKNNVYTDNINNIQLKFSGIQIFAMGPYTSKQTYTDDELKQIKDVFITSDTVTKDSDKLGDIYIHGSFLDHINGKRPHYTMHNLINEFKISASLGARGVILHIPPVDANVIKEFIDEMFGKYVEVFGKSDVEVFGKSDVEVFGKSDVEKGQILYLEINTYKNSAHVNYARADELIKLINTLSTSKYFSRLGLVIDTAHLWASGIKIDDEINADIWLSSITPHIKDMPIIIHLNDQKYNFGAGRDEHMPIGSGTCWSQYSGAGFKNVKKSGIKSFVKYAAERSTQIIMEYREDNTFISSIDMLKNVLN